MKPKKVEGIMATQAQIVPKRTELASGAEAAILAWADATTNASSRRRADLLRDKSRAVADFFAFTSKSPTEIRAGDVKSWQIELEERGLSPATVYSMVSKVSSFYRWALKDAELSKLINGNPVDLARPKAPKAYQSESTKSLDDDELDKLLAYVKAKVDNGDVVGKRDYALLIHFVLTGRRRAEVINLRWKDVKTNGAMLVEYHVKGGEIETRIVEAPIVKATMLDYLVASGRLETMVDDSPIWTRHDRAGEPGQQLTSHAFDKNVKLYAKEVGIKDFHLHQLRHTFARQAGDETGSLNDVQEALGHKNQATTRIYLERVGVKRDRVSKRLAERLGLEVD